MIFDVVNRAVDIAGSYFEVDFEQVVSDRNVHGIVTVVKVWPRHSADSIAALVSNTEPGLAIRCTRGTTSAQQPQSVREGRWTLVYEYVAVGSDVEQISIQAELAAEAILKQIDRLGDNQASGVVDAGPQEESVSIQITPGIIIATKAPMCAVTVTVPVFEEDSV